MKTGITEFIVLMVLALGWAVSRANHWLKKQFKSSEAFLNPSGERVLVLSNLGPEKTISIEEGKSVTEINLAKASVTALAWQ